MLLAGVSDVWSLLVSHSEQLLQHGKFACREELGGVGLVLEGVNST